MKKYPLIIVLIFGSFITHAQQKIKDGTGTPATSLPAAGSVLELQSTQAGLRLPQIALTNTTTWLPLQGSGAATTSPGMTVYNTNAGITSSNTNYPALGIGEYYWDGTGWMVKNPVAAAAYVEPWYNTATSTGATANTQNIYQMANVGIGTNQPNADLHVAGTIRVMDGGSYTGGIIYGTASTDGVEIVRTGPTSYLGIQRSSVGANLYLTKDMGTGAVMIYQNFNRSNSTIGSISTPASGNSINYNTTSDIRLKENIKATQYSIADVMKIKVADYNYKSDNAKTTMTGFLAQDLYKIFPDAVTPGGANEKTDPWQVDYSKLTPLLVKAIQDQQTIIEKLEARLKALEERTK